MEPPNIHPAMQHVIAGGIELMSLQPGLSIETNWDDDLTPRNLNSLQATIDTSYPFPIHQLDSAVISDDGMSNQVFADLFPNTNPRSRYASLDDGRPDSIFMLPMSEKTRSLSNDAKENNAKEVGLLAASCLGWPNCGLTQLWALFR